MAPGCKPGGLTPYVGSNPTPCTISKDEVGRMKDEGAAKWRLFHPSSFILHLLPGGSSSVGRASAFQAEGREFEPRLPLHTFRVVVRGRRKSSKKTRPRSSGVERLLGKEEVMSSNLIAGSIQTDVLHHTNFIKRPSHNEQGEI